MRISIDVSGEDSEEMLSDNDVLKLVADLKELGWDCEDEDCLVVDALTFNNLAHHAFQLDDVTATIQDYMPEVDFETLTE